MAKARRQKIRPRAAEKKETCSRRAPSYESDSKTSFVSFRVRSSAVATSTCDARGGQSVVYAREDAQSPVGKKRKREFGTKERTLRPFGNPGRVLRTNVMTSAPPRAISFRGIVAFLRVSAGERRAAQDGVRSDATKAEGIETDWLGFRV